MIDTPDKLFAIAVVQRLRDAGHEALWAGGCVRDLLMNHQPSDYDVATSARPEQVREVFGRKHTLAVGMSFGVMVVLEPATAARQIEVATFRNDGDYSDGRRPDSVVFSSAEEDAQRRDFTINGMFYDPTTDQVIDYVGGRSDLEQRVIRAIGRADDRIAEDKLRMLRAIRFAARFDFTLEPQTRAAIVRNANEVALISGERVSMELRKTLATAHAAWAVCEWADTGLLAQILPEIAPVWSRVKVDATAMLAASRAGDGLQRLCILLWQAMQVNAIPIPNLMQSLKSRLKLANDEVEAMAFSLASQSELENAENKPWSEIQPILSHRFAQPALELFEARAAIGLTEDLAQVKSTLAWLRPQLALPTSQLDPRPLLDGSDLIALGLRPSPKFSSILDTARQMQLDGQLVDRAAAMLWLAARVASSE